MTRPWYSLVECALKNDKTICIFFAKHHIIAKQISENLIAVEFKENIINGTKITTMIIDDYEQ